jgi:hypothetical protein
LSFAQEKREKEKEKKKKNQQEPNHFYAVNKRLTIRKRIRGCFQYCREIQRLITDLTHMRGPKGIDVAHAYVRMVMH